MRINELWAHIAGKDYPIAIGSSFSDELSETLDSGSIILPHVLGMLDIKPYDDIYIHDYGYGMLPARPYGQIFAPQGGHFYKHMLIQSFSEEQVTLADVEDPDSGDYYYNYTIQLISETKGLEKVQMPNRTITQKMNILPDGLLARNVSVDTMGYKFPQIDALTGFSMSASSGGTMYVTYGTDWVDATSMLPPIPISFGYNNFSKPKMVMQVGNSYYYPCWNVSSVSIVKASGNTSFVIRDIFPQRSWIVVKRTGPLPSRTDVYNYCYNNDNKSVGDEIDSNNVVKKLWTEESGSKYSSDKLDVDNSFENGVYDIYMYVPALYFPIIQQETGLSDFSVYSMVPEDSNKTDGSDAENILVRWTGFTVSGNTIGSGTDSVKSVYEVAREAVELYSPYLKYTVIGTHAEWEYRRKYKLDTSLRDILGNIACPEMSMNTPTLREFLTRIFYVKDMIPVVHDGVITAMSLSQRSTVPFSISRSQRSYERRSMDGSDYTDRLVRTYTDALSNDNTTKCVERVGFRNSSAPMMTLSNMRIELTHPVYDIEKIYMCYYKSYEASDGSKKMFLCKQDITPFVMLSSVRNLLSEDWRIMGSNPGTVSELVKFKYATIGYDIGSRYIGGWGEIFSYPVYSLLNVTYNKISVIELILSFMDAYYPYGINANTLINQKTGIIYQDYDQIEIDPKYKTETAPILESGADFFDSVNDKIGGGKTPGWLKGEKGAISDLTLLLKTMTFEIEYKGFISAPVVASKDCHDGIIVSRDNQSSSLAFVEGDGVNEKEKVNRLGNSSITVTQRVDDFNDMLPISSVRNEGIHEDEIMFKRSYVMNHDHVNVVYYLCKDFVLRNYFTSVYSKHRPFSLGSYEESVSRQENKTLEIVLSTDECYYQSNSKTVLMNSGSLDKLMTFWKETGYDNNGEVVNGYAVGLSYVNVPEQPVIDNQYYGYFAVDTQVFTSGSSICFNVAMIDNTSGGTYITSWKPSFSDFLHGTLCKVDGVNEANGYANLTAEQMQGLDDVTGALQDWYMYPVNIDNGNMARLAFGVGSSGVASSNGNSMKARNLVIEHNVEYSYNDDVMNNCISSMRMLPQLDVAIEYPNPENQTSMVSEISKPMRYINGVWESGKETGYAFDPYEFARSLFFGSVADGETERGDVVFKDGKEVMSTLLQLEPIGSHDVMFSKYMMQLSDVYGTKHKNYVAREYTSPVSMYIEKSFYLYMRISPMPNNGRMRTITGYPLFCLCIPNIVFNDMYNRGVADFDFEGKVGSGLVWGTDNSRYQIIVTLKKLIGSVSEDHLTLRAKVYIRKDGSVENGIRDIVLYNQESANWKTANGQVPDGQIWKVLSTNKSEYEMKRFSTLIDYVTLSDSIISTTPSSEYDEVYFDTYYGVNDISSIPYNYEINDRVDNTDTIKVRSSQIVSNFLVQGYGAEAEDRNMFWVYGDKMNNDTPFINYKETEFNNTFTTASVSSSAELFGHDSDGKPRIHIDTDTSIDGSIRLYYKENDVYNFVFGVNISHQNYVNVYVSLLDVRSKTVYDSVTGDPTYRIINYITDTGFNYSDSLNTCLPKEA